MRYILLLPLHLVVQLSIVSAGHRVRYRDHGGGYGDSGPSSGYGGGNGGTIMVGQLSGGLTGSSSGYGGWGSRPSGEYDNSANAVTNPNYGQVSGGYQASPPSTYSGQDASAPGSYGGAIGTSSDGENQVRSEYTHDSSPTYGNSAPVPAPYPFVPAHTPHGGRYSSSPSYESGASPPQYDERPSVTYGGRDHAAPYGKLADNRAPSPSYDDIAPPVYGDTAQDTGLDFTNNNQGNRQAEYKASQVSQPSSQPTLIQSLRYNLDAQQKASGSASASGITIFGLTSSSSGSFSERNANGQNQKTVRADSGNSDIDETDVNDDEDIAYGKRVAPTKRVVYTAAPRPTPRRHAYVPATTESYEDDDDEDDNYSTTPVYQAPRTTTTTKAYPKAVPYTYPIVKVEYKKKPYAPIVYKAATTTESYEDDDETDAPAVYQTPRPVTKPRPRIINYPEEEQEVKAPVVVEYAIRPTRRRGRTVFDRRR